MADESLRSSMHLLATRRFGTFWFASLLSNIGTWSQQIAEPWLLLSLGASPFLVGLDAFAQGAPVFLLILVGGAMADQLDRRRVIVFFQSIQMLCPTIIMALILAGQIEPWVVISLSLVVGVTDALSMPSFQSIVPSIVERDQIAAGLALNSTQFNLSRVLGPSLAGLLLATAGAAGAFGVNAASYVPFILVALWILPRAPGNVAHARFDRHAIATGIRAAAGDPALRGAMLTAFATSLLCGPLFTFTPVLVMNIFHGDATFLSLSAAAFGIGGLLGALGLLLIDPHRDRRPISSWVAVGYGLVVATAAVMPWRWGLPALLILAGASMTTSNTSANTFLQSHASPRLRGETVSLFMLATRGGASLGGLLTGIGVHFFGVRQALLIDGALAIGAQLLIGRVWRAAPILVSDA